MDKVYLHIVGDSRDNHTFFVNVEEKTGETIVVDGRFVHQFWLRANCRCGWVAEDDQRYTLEENVHWSWITHVIEGS